MQGPPEKRSRMAVEVTVGGGMRENGPWISRSLRLPFVDGQPPEIVLAMRLASERAPEDVETVVLEPGPSTNGMSDDTVPFLGSETLMDSLVAEATSQDTEQALGQNEGNGEMEAEGTLKDIEFKDYEELYKKWKAKDIDNKDVLRARGPGLLDLMQAQMALDEETQPLEPVPVLQAGEPRELPAQDEDGEGGLTKG